MVFNKIRKALSDSSVDSFEDEYLEIDLEQQNKKEKKVMVKLFSLKQYEDVNDILNSLREGYTIAVIDIQVLRKKDSIELKRAISKLKKTTDALEGNIAGFGENIVIVTPSFAQIHKEVLQPKKEGGFDTY
ncbi:MAG: cell division protein SepF [Nanoarchaeota archaeon]